MCAGMSVCAGVCACRCAWAGLGGRASRVGGKCGLVLQARWGGQGSLTLSPPGSIGPGPGNLHVTGTHCLPFPRLQMHGHGRALGMTGGYLRSLTAKWHRWRRRTSWVPHSHGLGRCQQAEGSQGTQSASLPRDLPWIIPGCDAAAPLVQGALGHTTGLAPPLRAGGGACPKSGRGGPGQAWCGGAGFSGQACGHSRGGGGGGGGGGARGAPSPPGGPPWARGGMSRVSVVWHAPCPGVPHPPLPGSRGGPQGPLVSASGSQLPSTVLPVWWLRALGGCALGVVCKGWGPGGQWITGLRGAPAATRAGVSRTGGVRRADPGGGGGTPFCVSGTSIIRGPPLSGPRVDGVPARARV